MCKVVL